MSFGSILLLVLVAAVILALLFIFFRMLIALIPLILILALVIWLINKFSKKSEGEAPTNWQNFTQKQNQRPPRKKARNVTTKDVDKPGE